MKKKKTLLVERLTAVLALLCDEAPPEELVRGWVELDESWVNDQRAVGPPMQEWVNAHCRVEWPLSIDVLDAATMIAESVRDGES